MLDIIEEMRRASTEAPWDDAAVERFIDRLGEYSVKVSLIAGSETEDPKDAIDIGPEGAIDGLPHDLLIGFMTHRRDLACYLRGLRGAGRADARGEGEQ